MSKNLRDFFGRVPLANVDRHRSEVEWIGKVSKEQYALIAQ
jgi:hypothetical protein